jgi:hypothetical protein
MRNHEYILNLSTCFARNYVSKNENLNEASVIQNKGITGPVCYYYLNSQELDSSTLVRAAIEKYFTDSNESVVVITDCYGNSQTVYKNIRQFFSIDRNIVYLPSKQNYEDYDKCIREVKEYLENPEGGVLVTDIKRFNGAQARNIIIMLDHRTLHYNEVIRNMILRTMSKAIVIHHEDIKKLAPGILRDDDLHEYIQDTPSEGNQEFIDELYRLYNE